MIYILPIIITGLIVVLSTAALFMIDPLEIHDLLKGNEDE